ncbi:MAG: right-handed parallel beta-helix repeat-containing protein [Candidatus Bipolaricaulota bacterium]
MGQKPTRMGWLLVLVLVMGICGGAGWAGHSSPGWQDVRAEGVCLRVPSHWHDFTAEMEEGLNEEGATVLGFWSSASLEDDVPSDAVALLVLTVDEPLLMEVSGDPGGDVVVELIERYEAMVAGSPGEWIVYRVEELYDVRGLEGRMWIVYQSEPLLDGRYLLFVGTEPGGSAAPDSIIHPILLSAAVCSDTRAQTCSITVQPDESIQDAIDATDEGAVICLGAGTLEANLVIDKDLTLRGAGSEETVIKGEEVGEPVIRVASDQEIEVVLDGITVAEARPGWPLTEEEDGVRVEGQAQLLREGSNVTGNGRYGIAVKDSARVTISQTAILENTYGVSVRDSANATLADKVVQENEADGSMWRVRPRSGWPIRSLRTMDNTASIYMTSRGPLSLTRP